MGDIIDTSATMFRNFYRDYKYFERWGIGINDFVTRS